MSYSNQEKALAICRMLGCRMFVQYEPEVQANSELDRKWCHGEDLMLAIQSAFKIWELCWRVQRERDIMSAQAIDLDTTCVDMKPPNYLYTINDENEKEHAEAYNIIERYRCRVTPAEIICHTTYNSDGFVRGVGPSGIIAKLFTLRDKMEELQREHKNKLTYRLGID